MGNVVRKHVVVAPYDEAWAQRFQEICAELQAVLGDTALRIEHVGSTSVPGLSAKPIIDIDVVIEGYDKLSDAVEKLATIGYQHEGNLGIPGREAFGYEGKEHLMRHHLYVCPQDSPELRRHLAFRDHLRANPEAVREYSRVKEEGAALYPYDIDGYIAHKAPLIARIYKEILGTEADSKGEPMKEDKKIVIRPLAPELAEDYFDFFDHRAFSDGSPFFPCYCNAFNMPQEQFQKDVLAKTKEYGGADGWQRALRESAYRMVLNGEIQGYLAYDGDLAIGWCNANDRFRYYRVGAFDLSHAPADAVPEYCPREGYIKAIVCFEIAPEYRGMGISGMLLERVIADAKQAGYSYVEGYPEDEDDPKGSMGFTGPLNLYRKAGFEEVEHKGSSYIVRKKLG